MVEDGKYIIVWVGLNSPQKPGTGYAITPWIANDIGSPGRTCSEAKASFGHCLDRKGAPEPTGLPRGEKVQIA
jgi:hypothetical protein